MSEPYVGQIKIFAGMFAPRGYALCDGQLLAISSNDVLFSLLGTTYGGDGRTTFALPDLRGRVPIHMGSGPGLTPRQIGQRGGVENVTLTQNQLPAHNHGPVKGTGDAAGLRSPNDAIFAETASQDIYRDDEINTTLAPQSVSSVGGSQSHDNMGPYQCVNFIIALYGIYPSRS